MILTPFAIPSIGSLCIKKLQINNLEFFVFYYSHFEYPQCLHVKQPSL